MNIYVPVYMYNISPDGPFNVRVGCPRRMTSERTNLLPLYIHSMSIGRTLYVRGYLMDVRNIRDGRPDVFLTDIRGYLGNSNSFSDFLEPV